MTVDPLETLTIDKSRFSPPPRKGGNRTRLVIVLIVAVIAATAAFTMFRNRAVTIETSSVSLFFPTQSFTLLNSSGYVVAQRKAAVASKTTGRLEWIGVEEGSTVVAGQIIARLENKDMEASVRQAEAALQNSKAVREQSTAELADAGKSFQRHKELLVAGIVSQAEYDISEARLKRAGAATAGAEAGIAIAAAGLQGASVNLGYSLIRAPFDAVVLTKNADVGDIITPLGAAANAKAAVVTIADLASLQVEADVSESNLAQIRQGQPCEITLDAVPGSRFQGVVHTIVPTADRSKASVMVKIRFLERDRRIFPEMSAKVAFLQHQAQAGDKIARVVINPAAVVTRDGRSGVYLVVGDKVRFTRVTAGAKLGELLEVSGLKSGDKVALKPLEKLKDGSRISFPEKK
ncbi:MAG: efflux RND transporter periplasmic adaptor subunit [Deltaproteobacteria bacterium]|nr:efflux RND transporter periplasmic adaptor subunit [Deltaproteobacteria bacterium]